MKFLIKIFSPIFFLISLFILIYLFYRSQIVHIGQINDYYQPYYIVVVFLIFFSICTFFLSKKFKEYIIISLISIFFSLYLFEFYLVFNEQIKKNYIYSKVTGKKYDTRSRAEIYKHLKKNDKNIKLTILPTEFVLDGQKIYSLSGISNSKTIFCNESGYYSNYESDRYGFNNPDNEWEDNNMEFVLVGDSFTHGACVNRPNDIASNLRRLSKSSALNLGQKRNGPLLEYATLREYLLPNTKKVLWIYFEGNDLIDLENELKNEILKKYYDDSKFLQNLKFKQKYIDKNGNILINLEPKRENHSKKFKFYQFIKLYKLRNIGKTRVTPNIYVEFKKVLQLTKNLTDNNNSELYFVYLPEYNRYLGDYDNSSYLNIRQIINDLDIPFIDIHKEIFAEKQNPLNFFPFKMNGHFTVEGYRKISEVIYNFTDR